MRIELDSITKQGNSLDRIEGNQQMMIKQLIEKVDRLQETVDAVYQQSNYSTHN